MSVLIKGMEMPKDRDTLVLVKVDGSAIVYTDEAYMTTAVPVPTPHGRLIDADVLIQNEKINSFEAVFGVAEAPTIIEAEEEDK